jgi:nitroreductase
VTNTAQTLSDLLWSHRSIRSFTEQDLPDALLERVIEDAIAGTSSSGNLNSVSVVVSRDPGRKQKLCDYHFGQPMVLEAPVVLTFCADWYRTRQWLKLRGARDNFNNLLGYHVAAFDAILLSQSVCLGLEASGLGICYMGTTLSSMQEISDLLELPETVVPVTSVVAGWPAEAPDKRDRLPASAIIHHEVYHRPDDRELAEIFASREIKGWQRYMSMPALKAEIERLGITSLAQFYTSEAKYDPEEFARDSEKIECFLRSKGFWPD